MSTPDLLQRLAAAQSRITTLEAEIRSLQSQPPAGPSALSLAIAATIVAALGSYFYTQAKSLNLFSAASTPAKPKPKPNRAKNLQAGPTATT
ncbi:hypothetical protein G7Y79_00060g092190 [Physcia stellaris]|nr:hypothetical protein G7Y79_00060g092190 [Physcia stellaris]